MQVIRACLCVCLDCCFCSCFRQLSNNIKLVLVVVAAESMAEMIAKQEHLRRFPDFLFGNSQKVELLWLFQHLFVSSPISARSGAKCNAIDEPACDDSFCQVCSLKVRCLCLSVRLCLPDQTEPTNLHYYVCMLLLLVC